MASWIGLILPTTSFAAQDNHAGMVTGDEAGIDVSVHYGTYEPS
jgi:hypothetical protein